MREPLRFTVEFLENPFAAVLCFILRLARLERLCQIAPKRVKPRICHLEKAAHESRTAAVKKKRGFRRVAILCGRAVAIAVQKAKSDQRINKIWICSRVQRKRTLNFAACHRSVSQLGKKPKLDRR